MTKQNIESKIDSKVVVGLTQGAYIDIELIPTISKYQTDFNEMVTHLKTGKFFVMRAGYTLNSLYQLMAKLRTKAGLQVCYSKTKQKDVTQFVLFVKKTAQ